MCIIPVVFKIHESLLFLIGGRRGNITFTKILIFATSIDEEPALGFRIPPSINFPDVQESYLPTANTCINQMNIPKATLLIELPKDDILFNLYDLAFANSFYGLR